MFDTTNKDNISVLHNYTDVICEDVDNPLIIDFNLKESIKRFYDSCLEISYDRPYDDGFKIQCPKCDSYDVFKEDEYSTAYTGTSVWMGSTIACRNCGYIN